jgi:hypothetical protein
VSLTGVVVNTFSSRTEDSTGGLSSNLPPCYCTVTCGDPDVIKHAATASDDSTQLLYYAAFASSVPLATSSPSSSPTSASPFLLSRQEQMPALLSGLLTPLSLGGKYVTDATLTLKGTVSVASGFFHESVSPKPLSIPLGPFRIFRKFAEIFAAQG